jgi:hypothetical protein
MSDQEIIIPVTFFLTVAAIFIVAIITRHRERILMMEKGLSSEEMKSMNLKDVRRDPLSSLKWGIVIMMAGFAAFIGILLHQYFYVEEGIIIGMLSLFVGIGLIVFYVIAAKKINR